MNIYTKWGDESRNQEIHSSACSSQHHRFRGCFFHFYRFGYWRLAGPAFRHLSLAGSAFHGVWHNSGVSQLLPFHTQAARRFVAGRLEHALTQIQPDEKLVRRLEVTNLIAAVTLTMGAWAVFSSQIALSVFLGAAIVSVSFQILKWQLRRAFQNPTQIPSKAGLFVSYYLRFLGTLFLVFVVMYYGWANPIAFLVGLSVVAMSIVVVVGREFLAVLEKKGET